MDTHAGRGYRNKAVSGFISHLHLCVGCHFFLRDGRQTECGHLYCAECVQNLTNCQAPDCGALIGPLSVFPDRATDNEVLRQKVYCEYRALGCQWTGRLKVYRDKHKEECQFIGDVCELCHTLVRRVVMTQHKADACAHRVITCEVCSRTYLAKHKQQHIRHGCPNYRVTCEDCTAIMKYEDLLHHQSEFGNCPRRMVPCALMIMGCRERFPPDDNEAQQTHDKKSLLQHLQMLAAFLLENEEAFLAKGMRSIELSPTHGASAAPDDSDGNYDDRLDAITRIRASVGVVSRDVEGAWSKITSVDEEVERWKRLCDSQREDISEMQSRESQLVEEIESLKRQVEERQHLCTDGKFIWRIDGYSDLLTDACTTGPTSLYSEAFYTHPHGYKLKLRMYPNGDGQGRGTHVSLFLVVCRGDYDPVLEWPFRQRVKFSLLNQQRGDDHIEDTFRTDPNSTSFQKPKSDMNIASGCPLFASHSALESPSDYVVDDVMFIKCTIVLA